MKILMISKYFSPEKAIAAVRPTKLSKYLHKLYDCEIDLLYLGSDDVDPSGNGQIRNVIRFPTRKCLTRKIINFLLKKRGAKTSSAERENKQDTKPEIKEEPKKKSFVKRLFYLLNFYAYKKDGYKTSRSFSARMLKRINFAEYDVIWSTFGPIESHLIAASIKKRYGNKWVADFRDALYVPVTPERYYKFCVKYARTVERQADYITYVSKGCGEGLCFADYKQGKKVLYNGFDAEEFENVSTDKFKKFTVVFTGQIYDSYKLTPVFDVIEELTEQKSIERDKLELLYVGPNGLKFENECLTHGLRENFKNLGYVDKKEAIEIQRSSHCLLLPCWNYSYSRGILSGKFYEYMCSGTPIVGVVSGDEGNSELKEMIEAYELGVCYEEFYADKDKPILKEFILKCYSKYKEGDCYYSTDSARVQVFNYRELTKELYSIFEEVCK